MWQAKFCLHPTKDKALLYIWISKHDLIWKRVFTDVIKKPEMRFPWLIEETSESKQQERLD